MNRIILILRVALAAQFATGLATVRAAQPAVEVPSGPVIELPPMVIEAIKGNVRWLYAEVDGDEYLSRCSPAVTRRFIDSTAHMRERLRAIVPDEFLADLPTITLLAEKDTDPKADDQVAQELLGNGRSVGLGRSPSVRFLPNLRLDDRDRSAVFAYLDDTAIAQTELAISPNYLRFLLERRTPMLPPWLVEGILAVRSQIDVRQPAVTLRPFVWLTLDESRAIARNPARPRALLSAVEMFAPDSLHGEGNHHPRRVQTLRAQVGLFVRWGLDPRNDVRDAFWTFARRAAEQRVTEEMFFDCFGFGFSDLRDRLNDYLPLALKDPLQLDVPPHGRPPKVEIREATPAELARLRGEWERLEIPYVERNSPDYTARYVAQARRTLQRVAGIPRGLASAGLCEIDAGNPAAGLPLLESAVTADAVGPRACYEVARLHFAKLMEGQPANRIFSAAELAPVLDPLRLALQQKPPLPEVYGLLADAWARSREPAPAGDVAALVQGAHYFALNPAVSFRIALALARCGRRTEAVDLLTTGAEYVTDDTVRARYTQLQTALDRAGSAAR